VVAAILANVPMIDKLDKNPLDLIKTADYAKLGSNHEAIRVWSRQSQQKGSVGN
jgi:hypothetical protein